MTDTNLANYEAIMNIFANLAEICGIKYGIGFLLAGILIAFLKKWGDFGKYAGLGLVITIIALAVPGLINYGLSALMENHQEAMLLPLAIGCGIGALVVLGVSLWLFYFPVLVAKQHGKTEFTTIMWLSMASIFFAPLWSVSIFLALKPAAVQSMPVAADAEPLN